jgi:hypothetical protein
MIDPADMGDPPAPSSTPFELIFSAPCDLVVAAFVKARSEMGELIKNNENEHFKNKYADLAAVNAAASPALIENGIAIIQGASSRQNATIAVVETMFLHSSGQYIKSFLELRPSKNDPQGMGSALTYARRYSLQAMSGLAPKDDDGNASGKARDAIAAGQPSTEKKPPKKLKPNDAVQSARWLALKALFDKAGPGGSIGAWLVGEGIAPDLATRTPRVLTNAECDMAEHSLRSAIAADAAFAEEDAPVNDELNAELEHQLEQSVEQRTRPQSVGISEQQRKRVMAMFGKRKRALTTIVPGDTDEARRHAFVALQLGADKIHSNTWTPEEYEKVCNKLELIPPDLAAVPEQQELAPT